MQRVRSTEETTAAATMTVTARVRPERPLLGIGMRVAGRYRVDALLGRGGFGEVYCVADHLHGDAPVALKVHRFDGGETQESLEAIRREFATLSSLAHAHLARVWDFGFLEGRQGAYFTQQLVRGVALDEAEFDPSSRRGARLISQLCAALQYLHDRGLLHRDVKPSNILVDEDDHLTLLDFGISAALGRSEADGRIIGTYAFLAPELIRGESLDPRADLYALGVTLYRALAGRLPFRGRGEALLMSHLLDTPPPLPPSVPVPVGRVVMRLLEKAPADRYGSAREVRVALARAGGTSEHPPLHEAAAQHLNSARFVGIDTSAFADRVLGPAALWGLEGAAGTGKSLLLRELRAHAQMRGAAWIQVGVGGETGANPLVQLARWIVSGEAALLTEEERVTLAPVLPELARAGEKLPTPLDPDRATAHRSALLSKILMRRWAGQDVVLAVDDLHLASARQREQLLRFFERVRGAVRVLVTGEGLRLPAHASLVTLAPFDVAHARAFARSALGDDDFLAGTSLARALSRAEVPGAWVAEVLLDAVERGALSRAQDGWARSGDLSLGDADASLRRRIERLAPQLARVARVSAVLGRPEGVGVIAALSGIELGSCGRVLSRAESAGLVEQQYGPDGEVLWRLRTRYARALTQITPASALRRLHERCAELLFEETAADWERNARAARHYRHAGRRGMAAVAYDDAATSAERAGRTDVACDLTEELLTLCAGPSRVGPLLRICDLAGAAGRERAQERAIDELTRRRRAARGVTRTAILLRLARWQLQRGELASARRRLAAGWASAARAGAVAASCQLALTAGEVELAAGRPERALMYFERARADGPEDASRVSASLGAALGNLRLGRAARAQREAQRAVVGARRLGDLALESEGLRHLGNALRERQAPRRALVLYRAAVATARRSGRTDLEAKALNNVGSTAHLCHGPEEAVEAWRRSIVLKQRLGARASELLTWANLASVLTATGRHAEAEDALRRVLAEPDATDSSRLLALTNRGDLHFVRGELDAAVTAYATAERGYREASWNQLRAHPLMGSIRALVARGGEGDLERAEALMGRFDALRASHRVAQLERRWAVTRAVVALARGDAALAARCADEAVALPGSHAELSDVTGTRLEAQWLAVRAREALGQDSGAQLGACRASLAAVVRTFHGRASRRRFLAAHPLHRAIRARRAPGGFKGSPAEPLVD